MNFLKNKIKNILWKHWMNKGIRSLKKNNDEYANKIREAINATINQELTFEEKTQFERIERIRKKFANNSTSVDIVDFGAGAPDCCHSEDKMQQGTPETTTYGVISMGSKPPIWAHLLFSLVRKFKPEIIIELGTCIGISASYQASALHFNGKGRLITIEGAEAISRLAKNNIASLGLDNVDTVCGRFMDVLPSISLQYSSIDYVFIDGHHDEKATIDYYNFFLPHLSPGALVIFDDISWSAGMKRAWDKIKADKSIALAVDLKMIGICVISPLIGRGMPCEKLQRNEK